MTGCASTPPEKRVAHDPLQGFNRAMFSFNEGLDKAILKPVAQGYDKVLPQVVSDRVSSFFSNLEDPMIGVNQLLQGKPDLFVSDLSRFLVNSTFGVLGLFDPASSMGMPKHEEDFGQTFGVWGADPGPYLVLPVFGPSNIRDGVGLGFDIYFDPIWGGLGDDRVRWGMLAVKWIDIRAGLLRAERILKQADSDQYAFVRESFLQRRASLIHDGAPPLDDEFELFEEDLYLDEGPQGEEPPPGDPM